MRKDMQELLPMLKEQVDSLRGWRSKLSLKTIGSFGLYKWSPKENGNIPYDTSPAENAMLAQLVRAVMAAPHLTVPNGEAWAQYVHWNFNKCHEHPFCGHLALQVNLRWSRWRLTIAAMVPLLLSLVVGFWYTFKIGDGYGGVSSAWTIASYIVTAGPFLIALLVVLSGLKL